LEGYDIHLPPKISIAIPEEAAVEGREMPLYITVDHMSKDEIHTDSFQMDDKPVSVTSMQEEKVAPDALAKDDNEETLVVSRYRVILPKKSAGVYTIGPVSVIVGQARYSSNTISLNVQEAIVSKGFRLTTQIEAPPKIFPGQMVVFEYQIFFQGSMQLLREELPLLNVNGFLTIGSPEITTEATKDGYVQEIKQKARALVPGTYEIGVSTIEGVRVEGAQGESTGVSSLYRAQAPSTTVTILSFPNANRPNFFDGALGSFVWRVSVSGGKTVSLGEPVHIEYRVSGRGELSTVQFPSFDRLPGLIDSFWADNSPPVGEEAEGTKIFSLVVRPKRLGSVEIPGFLTCSFDPYSEQYLTSTVPPIKLLIEGTKEEAAELSKSAPVHSRERAQHFEIDATTATERYLSPMWIAIVGAVSFGLGIVQFFVHRQLHQKNKSKMTSRDLFYRAVMNRGNREKGLQLLQKAFYERLYEIGVTPIGIDSPEKIVGEGIIAEVKSLLQMIDRQLYKSGEQRVTLQEIYDEASSLYYRLKQIQPEKNLSDKEGNPGP
jgi:hypothetical protein